MGQDDAPIAPGLAKTSHSGVRAYLDSQVTVTVLPHHVLLDMGQGGLKACFDGADCQSDPLQKVERIWQDLLATTRSRAVSDRHLTAACNAMCVFLECACFSLLPCIRNFGMSKETWLQCFGAILESFEEGKSKPMRQVLVTLANILTHHSEQVVSSTIQMEVLARMTEIVLLGEVRRLKAALIVMELFVRRVSTFDDVLISIRNCVQNNRAESSRRLALFGISNVVDDLAIQASISDVAATESERGTTMIFVVALFMALLSRDTQSAAIALFKTYSTTLIGSGRRHHLYSTSVSKSEDSAKARAEYAAERVTQSPWVFLTKAFLDVHPTAVTPFMDFLFPAVFKQDPNGYKEYTDSLQGGDCSLINILAVVQVGYHSGLDRDPALTLTRTLRGIDVHAQQADHIYGVLLSHADGDVRVRAFALLLASSSTTTPLSTTVLQSLAGCMKCLYGDSDPKIRSEVMSIVRKLVIRLQGGASFLHKSTINAQTQPQGTQGDRQLTDLRQHENFLVWFTQFLEDELRPGVSYQRHVMALQTIDLLVRSGLDNVIPTSKSPEVTRNQPTWPIHVSLHHHSIAFAALDLVMDPFEDVRIASLSFLETLASAAALPMHSHVGELVGRAERLASRTSRADHADGSARLQKLYYITVPGSSFPNPKSSLPTRHTLVEEILSPVHQALADVKGDLQAPLQQISLHGRLLSLRYLLQDQSFACDVYEDITMTSLYQEDLIQRIINLCQQVWQKVRYRLCIDSPENSEDDLSEEIVIGPKDMLSYSWRALRDSSLLICALLDASMFREQTAVSATKLKCFDNMGTLCMEQLSDLRHRGAFSTVAQTFSVLCGRLSKSDDDSVARLRDVWYSVAVTTLDKQAARLTRRSAGLPAMIAGLLNACPQVFFQRFFDSFTERAMKPESMPLLLPEDDDQHVELPQVHALNCLKEVFTNARFRTITEPHVMDLLNLAATSLSSDIWAIRNCGLMLFRACTSRLGRARVSLLSGQDSLQSWTSEATVSSDRAPDVIRLVVNLLNPNCCSQEYSKLTAATPSRGHFVAANGEMTRQVATETVFAALDLIGRIDPASHREGCIEDLIIAQLASDVWQVREQAAIILASSVSPWDPFRLLGRLVHHIFVPKDQNMVHGRLLCIRQCLRSLWRSAAEPIRNQIGQAATLLTPLIAPIMAVNMASVVQATFLDIMNDAFEAEIVSRTSADDSSRSDFWIGGYVFTNTDLSDGPCFPKHESAALHEAYDLLSTQCGLEKDQRLTGKFRSLFHNLAKTDFDAAARFLERIISKGSWSQNVRNVFDDLYQSIVMDEFFPEDVRTKAMAGLITDIESNLILAEQSTSLTQMSHRLICDLEPQRRDLRNAELRLLANIFTLGGHVALTQLCPNGHTHLSVWITVLREAAWDDIDTPTRLNAASSLFAFAPNLLSDRKVPSLLSCYLQVYFILYDLLNDDDYEVREIATSAASVILNSEAAAPGNPLTLAPLAASEKLAFFMAREFQSERKFIGHVLWRTWFSSSLKARRETVGLGLNLYSAKDFLEGLQQDSTVLFEEEKQNLYIDDVREVQIWSDILKSIKPPEESLLNSIGDWVVAALHDLRDHLKSKVDFDGPLGLTSQGDILTLFVRVIELAGITVHWASCQPEQIQEVRSADRSDTSPPTYPWAASILFEIKALEESGSRISMHERIMRSIEDILKKQ